MPAFHVTYLPLRIALGLPIYIAGDLLPPLLQPAMVFKIIRQVLAENRFSDAGHQGDSLFTSCGGEVAREWTR